MFIMNLKIIYGKGVEELNDDEKAALNRSFEEYSLKIDRQLKQVETIEVYVKGYGKTDGKKKYSIHLRVISPLFFESDADDWDFSKTIHMAFTKLLNEIEHRLHTSNQRGNFRKGQNKRERLD